MLGAYARLLNNAQKMLAAASEQRWDDLAVCENEREACLVSLADTSPTSTNPNFIVTRNQFIHAILECDERTKALVHERRSELSELMDSVGNERKLADAYRGA